MRPEGEFTRFLFAFCSVNTIWETIPANQRDSVRNRKPQEGSLYNANKGINEERRGGERRGEKGRGGERGGEGRGGERRGEERRGEKGRGGERGGERRGGQRRGGEQHPSREAAPGTGPSWRLLSEPGCPPRRS